jgi:predicted transcriptional regulator
MGTGRRFTIQSVEWERIAQSREPVPSAASLDSQSVKIAILTDHAIGYDGGKKIKGRRRHLLVDTLGIVMMVVMTAANVSD